MKKFITLSSAALTAVVLFGAAAPVLADQTVQNSKTSTATVAFTAGTDTTTPPNVTNPEAPNAQGPDGTTGAIAIDYASNLDFGSHEVSATDETYYASADSTAFADAGKTVGNFVEMHDLRGDGAGKGLWTLQVTQGAQFTNTADSTQQLKDAALSFSDGTAANAQGGTYKPDATASFTLNPGTTQTVMTGDGTVGQFLASYGTASDYKGNETGGPISLSVPAGSAAKGTYTSTLTWDLVADPS